VLAYNVLGLAEVAKSNPKFSILPKKYRHKNNFKLNLNLPFLQTCVSISAVIKINFYVKIKR